MKGTQIFTGAHQLDIPELTLRRAAEASAVTMAAHGVVAVHLEVRVPLDDDHTLVVRTEGAARRDPLDDHDRSIGLLMAAGRAFERAGRQLRREAEGRVEHADQVRKKQDKDAKRSAKKRPGTKAQGPKAVEARKRSADKELPVGATRAARR